MNRERDKGKTWKYGYEPFYPNHIIKQIIQISLVLAVLVFLSSVVPPPMLPKVDPFISPDRIRPDWYFLAAYQFLKFADEFRFLGPWAPKLIGVLGQGAGGLLLLFLPFLDKNPAVRPGRRPRALKVGVAIMLTYLILTFWGYYW
jgi:ubiquinol-cytochrome c reductase cytochrome b subunit